MSIEIQEFMNGMESISFKRSEESVGEKSYAYAYGYFHSVMSNTLENLNLTKKQKKILENQLKNWSTKYV